MKTEQVHELLYQALETEQGGIQVYETAVGCAQNADLKKEWKEYLEQTRNHERILLDVFQSMGLDPRIETPGRTVVRHLGQSLVKAMQMAKQAGNPSAAEIVAAECVVLAETKDHANWELIGEVAKNARADKDRDALKRAYEEVEEQEDEHLYHTRGWARELWVESLGMPAVLPPPEEEKDVKTEIGAARAKQSREDMLGKH
jgi:rubrerythrin